MYSRNELLSPVTKQALAQQPKKVALHCNVREQVMQDLFALTKREKHLAHKYTARAEYQLAQLSSPDGIDAIAL
jgi:hypothetical protein